MIAAMSSVWLLVVHFLLASSRVTYSSHYCSPATRDRSISSRPLFPTTRLGKQFVHSQKQEGSHSAGSLSYLLLLPVAHLTTERSFFLTLVYSTTPRKTSIKESSKKGEKGNGKENAGPSSTYSPTLTPAHSNQRPKNSSDPRK